MSKPFLSSHAEQHVCSIRWALDGFCHSTLSRCHLWREVPPFQSFEILNHFLLRKQLCCWRLLMWELLAALSGPGQDAQRSWTVTRDAPRRPVPAHAGCGVDLQLLHVQRYPSQGQFTSWSRFHQHMQFVFPLCFQTYAFPFMLDSYQPWCFCFSAVLYLDAASGTSVKLCLFHLVFFFPSAQKRCEITTLVYERFYLKKYLLVNLDRF